jgi:hypothetical protein
LITINDFRARVIAVFPELSEQFAGDDGLHHLQMSSFARLMQAAKGRSDWETYERAARLAEALWAEGDPALRNVLGVSLLEHLDFEGPRGPRAWELLGTRLQHAWRSVAPYNDRLRAGAKESPPPADGPGRRRR